MTAVIQGAGTGPGADRTIVLRGDMDALPLTEHTGLDFASEHPGVMHACGHDTHVAMVLGGARLLLDRRDSFAGRAVLMFQPGEEGHHGARFMIEDGLLDGIEGTPGAAAFAIHISTRYPTGTLNLRHGPLLAAADRLVFTVRGRGGHASAPFLALDPVTVAAEVRLSLERQLLGSVRWEASMRALMAAFGPRFVEIGPGRVLKGLARSIDRAAAVENVETPDSIEAFFHPASAAAPSGGNR